MPKTGTRPRNLLDGADGVVDRLGIAGAVGEKNAVGLEGEHIFGGGLRGTTVTRQPSRVNMRRMFSLMPKS